MQIDRLSLRNFRAFDESTFEFHSSFNLLIGKNGIGKTSLLHGISSSLVSFLSILGSTSFVGMLADDEVRMTAQVYNNSIRFEKHFPVIIGATGCAFGNTATWEIRKRSEAASIDYPDGIFRLIGNDKNALTSEDRTLPIVAYYRPDRGTIGGHASLDEVAKNKPSRLDAYHSWFNAAANQTSLEAWVIGKTLEHLQSMADGDDGSAYDKEFLLVNAAVARALPELTGLRYDLRMRSLMLTYSDSTARRFSDLSDGQRGMISLVADIARRMCILNPHLGEKILTGTDGVVIIDEIDIHLHPEWQRRIIEVLKSAFPLIQFFASSHSPQMIGALTPEEVLVLEGSETFNPSVSLGLDASRVLEAVMDTRSRDPKIEEKLKLLFGIIDKGDLEAAKRMLAEFREGVPDLPDYAQASALIRRKEIIGR